MLQDTKGYIFRCSNATQKECFEKMLFGDKLVYRSKQPVRKGDILFLYNVATEILQGVFVAETDATINIDREAWGGDYPWQVKVAWKEKYEPIGKKTFSTVVPFGGLRLRYPSSSITSRQVTALIEIFKENQNTPAEEAEFRDVFPADYRAQDGHWVRSMAELTIDNWLFNKRIVHGYEARLPSDEVYRCDFFLPIVGQQEYVYIEYWGMEDKKYQRRKEQKLEIYKKHGLPLVQLTLKELRNLDETLSKMLRPYINDKKL